MYDELVKRIQKQAIYLPEKFSKNAELLDVLMKAADAIEELIADRDKYKRHSDSISQLPDCNTCGKKIKGDCEFLPAWGDWVRINCAFWTPEGKA